MKWLDLTLPSPAENLAGDEAFLDQAEAGDGGEILRFWEPRDYFVVVGYANRVGREVNGEACAAAGIPILRRCSGGGTVLQGPGCLNYTLVLQLEEHSTFNTESRLQNIPAANRFIMERNRAALARLFPHPASRTPQPGITVRGHTDLALGELKFSGNAQRRRKRFLLFHGTFLLNFDLAAVEKFLRLPSQQPDYRRNRSHAEFLTNLGVAAAAVKEALREAWQADVRAHDFPARRIEALVRNQYVTKEWNLKFE